LPCDIPCDIARRVTIISLIVVSTKCVCVCDFAPLQDIIIIYDGDMELRFDLDTYEYGVTYLDRSDDVFLHLGVFYIFFG